MTVSTIHQVLLMSQCPPSSPPLGDTYIIDFSLVPGAHIPDYPFPSPDGVSVADGTFPFASFTGGLVYLPDTVEGPVTPQLPYIAASGSLSNPTVPGALIEFDPTAPFGTKVWGYLRYKNYSGPSSFGSCLITFRNGMEQYLNHTGGDGSGLWNDNDWVALSEASPVASLYFHANGLFDVADIRLSTTNP